MEIRSFRESDKQAVIELWNITFPQAPEWNDFERDITRKLGLQRELFLVVIIDSAIVGTAMAGFDGHRGWVHYVAVHPQFQYRGIGTQLMRRIETELKNIGCTKLNLQIRASNRGVIAFYEKAGYNIEERVSMAKLL